MIVLPDYTIKAKGKLERRNTHVSERFLALNFAPETHH